METPKAFQICKGPIHSSTEAPVSQQTHEALHGWPQLHVLAVLPSAPAPSGQARILDSCPRCSPYLASDKSSCCTCGQAAHPLLLSPPIPEPGTCQNHVWNPSVDTSLNITMPIRGEQKTGNGALSSLSHDHRTQKTVPLAQ